MTPRDAPARRPRFLYEQGTEPDPRFSLANERTFLAWIRTGLALLLAAVAIDALLTPADVTIRTVSSLSFAFLGLATMMHSWLQWCRTEIALRLQRRLPGFGFSTAIVGLSSITAFVVVLGLVLR